MESSLLNSAMCPVFWISRISGLFPYRHNSFNISLFWMLLPPSLLVLLTANIYFFFFYGEELSGFTHDMYFMFCLSLYISVASLILLSYSSGEQYKKLNVAALDLETLLIQLGIQFKYDTKIIFWEIILRATYIVIVCALNYKYYIKNVLQVYLRAIGFYLTQWCLVCVEVQLIALCSFISCLLKSMISSLPSPDVDGFLEASTCIVEISEIVQDLFSIPSFIILSVIFICITADCYFLLVALPSVARFKKMFAMYRSTTRCYQLWRLVSAVSEMSNQGKKLDSKLYTMALNDPTNRISKKKKLILYFSMKQKLELSACRLFPINFTLFHSMVAAITNYLVILLQFAESSAEE